MTHGSNAERSEQDQDHEDEGLAGTSNRFRIQIDAFGRVVPKVIRVDDDAKADESKK